MPTFIVTTTSTFRHAYLIEAETHDQARDIAERQTDSLHEWHQEHLGEVINHVESVDPAALPALHEQTLRDKTNWWLPVTSFLNRAIPSPPVEETDEDHVEESGRPFDLERDLVKAFWTNPAFTRLVRDELFVKDLYGALCNTEWFHIRDTNRSHPWSCTWRYAGGVVSSIRNRVAGLNEDYMDYYCSGNEGIVSPRVDDALWSLGWVSEPMR